MLTVAGLILAGGAGERLGGINKGQLLLDKMSLFARVHAVLKHQTSVIYVANGQNDLLNVDRNELDIPVQDLSFGPSGPVAGLFSTVQKIKSANSGITTLASLAVDSPCIPSNLISVLQKEMRDDLDAVMCAYEGQLYPTNTLWRVSALEIEFESLKDSKKRTGLKNLLPFQRVKVLDFSSSYAENPFRNINTLADIAHFAAFFNKNAF